MSFTSAYKVPKIRTHVEPRNDRSDSVELVVDPLTSPRKSYSDGAVGDAQLGSTYTNLVRRGSGYATSSSEMTNSNLDVAEAKHDQADPEEHGKVPLGQPSSPVASIPRTPLHFPPPSAPVIPWYKQIYEGVRSLLIPTLEKKSVPVWTGMFALMCCFVFAFMAGQYRLYIAAQAQSNGSYVRLSPLVLTPRSWNPWFRFWSKDDAYTFDFNYLKDWGGRYGPLVKSEPSRIFTSLFLHTNFNHVLSNMIMWIILAAPLERAYSTLIIGLIWLACAMAAQLCSMAFEDPCLQVVGASGPVFGFIGLYFCDILVNFETTLAPWFKLISMAVSLIVLIGLQFLNMGMINRKVSHWSHIGGFLAGLVVSYLFLPNYKSEKWRYARRSAKELGRPVPVRGSPEYNENRSKWHVMRWPTPVAMVLSVAMLAFLYVALPLYVFLWPKKDQCEVV